MRMTTPYTEAAAAPGAWTKSLRLPAPAPLETVRRTLTALAHTWPVAAFLPGRATEPVAEVMLYRDPSRTHGTPAIPRCEAAAQQLAHATGWTPLAAGTAEGVLVGLGLREGYNAGATEHEAAEVAELLRAASPTGWRSHAARLISARCAAATVRWYAEDGVIIHAHARLLPAIQTAAIHCAQHRYTVTDLSGQRTYALQQRGGARPQP
ncbi:hypothetical protein AB0I84_23275 [Streptomyces spectabilis]|uniref:hypothetical protein n=1 Tax=Streptomyces spectabilis TaxID=68270 RepID=UPI0033D2AD68